MNNFLKKISRKIRAQKKSEKYADKIEIVVKTKLSEINTIVQHYNMYANVYSGRVRFVTQATKDKEVTRYLYEPVEECLDEFQMLQAVYCLLNVRYDFVVVSRNLSDFPLAGGKNLLDNLIWWDGYDKEAILMPSDGISRCGRFLRLPGKIKIEDSYNVLEVMSGYRFEDEFRIKYGPDNKPVMNSGDHLIVRQKKSKPIVFVLPIFMAVGGVERNTIETMRALQERYTFVVITMERHLNAQGSLHDQLYGLCDMIYDLREEFEFDDYLLVLKNLRDMYEPDVVWLCNNSPWLEQHSVEFRHVFEKSKIVAQDVYDTKFGWIEYYDSEGIQSFDRYIAINQKIREAFVEKYHINEEQIDVIYPVVDNNKIEEEKKIEKTREEICSKYGLDSSKRHFAYVGRLTEQKDPVRFVQLATLAINAHEDMEWIIVGDGHLKDAVDEAIQNTHMQGKIIRIPYVKNVPELYRVIDGLIMVSIYEGMPIVSIEAMSMGVPVFGTDVGDLALFVRKYNLGDIIPIENEDDFDDFENWLANYDMYKKNAVNNAQEILNFFSAKQLSKLYIECFEKESKF